MVKTLRISDRSHQQIVKIQGYIQGKKGEVVSMDDVINELMKNFKWKAR